MKHLRKTILYILLLALCLSLLAGCGGGKDGNAAPGTPGTPAADDAEHPDFVYTSEFVPIEGDYSSSFESIYYNESTGKLLASMYGKIGERELEEGEVLEWEGQNWIYGNQLYWISLDGSAELIENYTPMTAPETDGSEGDDSGSYMQSLMMDAEGNIITLDNIYHNWYDGPDDLEMYSNEWWNAGYYELYMHNEQKYYLRKLAADGSEISCTELSGLAEASADPQNFYVGQTVMGPDGKVYLTSDQAVFVADTDGNLLKTITMDTWVDTIVTLADSVAVSYWGEEGEVLCVIDPETLELGEPKPARNSYNATSAPADSGYDYYYTDGSNLMGCKLATGEYEKILNWVNCDVDSGSVGQVCALPDGRILTFTAEWDENYEHCTNELVFISKVPYDAVAHKQTLTLATQYLFWDARSAIIDFNRSNSEYRIELLDYSEYNTDEDYSAGLTKLTTEILAGNVPDIIDLNGMPLSQFASKGLLTDLYPLLDADSELSRESLFPSVIKALETDGHLYRTAASFSVSTVMGAAGIVGDTPGWTLDDFKAALARMPEGCTPFEQTTTRKDILNNMLYMEMDNLIDWNTGACYFDSPAFRNILEFAAQFPAEFDWNNYEWTEEDDAPNRIAAGKQMLMNTTLSDFGDFQMYNAMFGGDATFIGYPVSEGVGNALAISDSGYAISAKCAYPEAAWQFLRQFFTEDYQQDNTWAFPTNKAAFDKKLTDAMTPEYEKDINGNFILDENGKKIEVSRGGYGWGSFTVDIKALTQAEADKITDLINSTTRVLEYSVSESNSELMNIITSDTEAFFLGQKPLDEVVKLLQSKLNILINEKR